MYSDKKIFVPPLEKFQGTPMHIAILGKAIYIIRTAR